MDVPDEAVNKMQKAFSVWEANFGKDRAMIIATKVASPKWIIEHSVLELITVGEKWHYANLLFQGKITNKEFTEKFPK